MKSRYLWNRAIENVSLDYSLCYDFFFFSILDGVAAQDEVNREDGHWQGQKRMYYYSRLESDAPLSRTPGEAYVGSGIYLLDATRLGDDYIGIVVMVVIPGTPAAEAGLVRGDFITAVNGEEVTESNYQSLGQAVYDGAVDVTVNSVTWTDNGTTPVLTPKGNVQLGSATFTSPAIYMDKVVEIEESDKKAGYLLYMGFDVDYDEELIAAFDRFRAQNVTDLILDLRYNNGGDVLSSTVLGTLIAGEAYKGQLYAHMTFNEDRTEAGESGDYKIGVKETVERIYEPLETALQHAVGLKKIYVLVSQTTASASEMVINGLRGLDIEVNLIGQTTNGKNVGMEGVMRSFYNHEFLLYPVTFYVENAKGFRDYSTGFVPDVEIDDSAIYPGEFGTMEDQLGYIALVWIKSGKKPELQASSLTRGGGSPMKPFGDLWDIRPIRPMGGAVMRPRTDE